MAIQLLPLGIGIGLTAGSNFIQQLINRRAQKRAERVRKAQAAADLEAARIGQRQAEEAEAERFPTMEGKTTPHGFGRTLSQMAGRRLNIAKLNLRAIHEARKAGRKMRVFGPFIQGAQAVGSILTGSAFGGE